MKPFAFPQCNTTFEAPDAYAESQVQTIPGFAGKMDGGSLDGAEIVIVAWKLDDDEVKDVIAGKPIYLCVVGGLPPHLLTTKPQFE